MRSLLDTREHCLNEFNFPDPYSKVSTAFSWVSGCMLVGEQVHAYGEVRGPGNRLYPRVALVRPHPLEALGSLSAASTVDRSQAAW